ncbi:hypothetical protein LTR15_007442 [Elasticomyces elasticus]|nr:hypothetical protein LTR15_007442 [Elasticomyces elasticus]
MSTASGYPHPSPPAFHVNQARSVQDLSSEATKFWKAIDHCCSINPSVGEPTPTHRPTRLIDIETGGLVNTAWGANPRLSENLSSRFIGGLFDQAVGILHEKFPGHVDPISPSEDESLFTARVLNPEATEYQQEVYRLAVQEARRRGVRYVWLDGFCINQSDDMEKAQEVSRMADYYGDAECCVVISELLRRKLCLFYNRPDSEARAASFVGYEMSTQVAEDTLFAWMIGYHHHRIWTAQETYLAKEIVVYGSGVRIDATWFRTQVINRSSKLEQSSGGLMGVQFMLCLPMSVVAPGGRPSASASAISQTLSLLEDRDCHLPHDRIYGTLGFLPRSLKDRITVDYTRSLGSVFATYIYSGIHAGELGCLFKLRDIHQEAHSVSSAPSWLPTGYGYILDGVTEAKTQPALCAEVVSPSCLRLDMNYLPLSQAILAPKGHDNYNDEVVEELCNILPSFPRNEGHDSMYRPYNIFVQTADSEVPFFAAFVEPVWSWTEHISQGWTRQGDRYHGGEPAAEVQIAAFKENERHRYTIYSAAVDGRAVIATFGTQKHSSDEGSDSQQWLWLILCRKKDGSHWTREGVATSRGRLSINMTRQTFFID